MNRFNASLDEQCESHQDNNRAADRNTNPVHAPLEPEEIGKPGVLILHFAEDIRDHGAGCFRGAAEQCSYPAYQSHGQRDVARCSGEAEKHDLHVAPMADERVRQGRVEDDLIHNWSPHELANFLDLFPDARCDDRLKVLPGKWSWLRFTRHTFLPYIL